MAYIIYIYATKCPHKQSFLDFWSLFNTILRYNTDAINRLKMFTLFTGFDWVITFTNLITFTHVGAWSSTVSCKQ